MNRLFNGKRAIVVLVALLCAFVVPFDRLDWATYDHLSSFLGPPKRDAANFALVAIDNNSIRELGRWPWSRQRYADLIRSLLDAEPSTVVFDLLFSEPEPSLTSAKLEHVIDQLQALGVYESQESSKGHVYQAGEVWEAEKKFINKLSNDERETYFEIKSSIVNDLVGIEKDITESINLPPGDEAFQQTMSESPLDFGLPFLFTAEQLTDQSKLKNKQSVIAQYASSFAIEGSFSTKREGLQAGQVGLVHPIPVHIERSAVAGHINYFPESNGVLRKQRLFLQYHGKMYPSLALSLASQALGYDQADILFRPGLGAKIGHKNIFFDDQYDVFLRNLSKVDIPVVPFSSVVKNEIDPDFFRNKIVIIGLTAKALAQSFEVVGGTSLSASEVLVRTASELTNGHYAYTSPSVELGTWVVYLVLFLVLFYFSAKMNVRLWLLGAGILVISTLVIQYAFLDRAKIWMSFSPLLGMYGFSLLSLVVLQSNMLERLFNLKEIESNENNRILGLTYQGQGQLDLAFEKLRKCKLDTDHAALLYSLGLDFERKRQIQKAKLVYLEIQQKFPSFRDIESKINLIDGHPGGSLRSKTSQDDATVKMSGQASQLEKPHFGRYKVIKELGRGGMGTVYLGTDPKIDRTVAIKTLDFTRDYSGSSLEEARKSFYREAKAIGKLNHRNIVTVFDAGEDHDLAYIAMAYLPGTDLKTYTSKANLLPTEEVVSIGIACADALSYSHRSGVIHRDIKPSNIIYHRNQKSLWLTDFGIALVQEADHTQTNSILGSPSYMSPEQIIGEKLDGASDIYSLGVTLFELLAGDKPFRATNGQPVIHAILSESTPQLCDFRVDVDSALNDLILKCMQREKRDRFLSADELKEALRSVTRK